MAEDNGVIAKAAQVTSVTMHKTAYFIGPNGLALNPTKAEIERLAREMQPIVAAIIASLPNPERSADEKPWLRITKHQ